MDRLAEELAGLLRGQCCGWNKVLDVAIVAVFVYYLLVLIRGTRAVQLLLGVLVLVAVYLLAVLLRLTLTTLLLQAAFAVALVAIPIIFQPELRRALGTLGRLGPLNRLMAPSGEDVLDSAIEQLVRAALLISAEHHGALIVVERGTGLQDYSETGVAVHARLSAELLASIFMVRSPLHDGAVIVRRDQILAAACLLPIDEEPERAHRYGMRHRAAISISSQTDAVVVVISEETGAISVANNGRIIGGLDEERLRRVLSSLLRPSIQPLPFRTKAS